MSLKASEGKEAEKRESDRGCKGEEEAAAGEVTRYRD